MSVSTRDDPARPTVVVVGGGIAGLSAAWHLSASGAGSQAHGSAPRVVVLEASRRLGGKVASQEVAGRRIDVGPDGFLGRRPAALELCRELGLEERLVPVGADGASVWSRGRVRALPGGLALGVPTRLGALARSRVLGPLALARVAMDAVVPRPDVRGPLADRAIGPLVARKLGRRVVQEIVDPLVGGIHAGTTADMSAAAVFPALLDAAQGSGSLMRALRRRANAQNQVSGTSGVLPAFWTLEGGMETLPERLGATLRARGVELRTAAQVRSLERAGDSPHPWLVSTPSGPLEADGLVLAVPAPQAATLLAPHEVEAARLLATFDHSSVCVVTMALDAGALPAGLHGTGVLVPRTARSPVDLSGDAMWARHAGRLRRRRRAADRAFLVTAFTFLSRKWPHLREPATAYLRASLGRIDDRRADELDDHDLIDRATAEMRVVLGVDASPRAGRVMRWPDALPQYRVHQLLRVAAIESALQRLPAVAVAGATYHGVGLPACIDSGRAAAAILRDALASPAPSHEPR